ncbi:SGNH/GDSL hydrolase family protein [Sorangium sp. So ce128]|uniref:SGNH/GDSL hydrolase family protein n=1 Tax=Sorangium sp. So ce128 TaxID=3133281 RepID=UPI003F5D7713
MDELSTQGNEWLSPLEPSAPSGHWRNKMRSTRSYVATKLSVLGLLSIGIWACGEANDGGTSSTGGGGPDGTTTSSAETTVGTGDMATSGAGGAAAGSTASSSSSSSSNASTAEASSSASGGETVGTGGEPGECVKGQTKGNQVAVIGESFIAATHGITQQIEKQAKANGSLPQNDRYIDNSVSGTTLANDQIPSQYRKAAENGMIKYVLMDGGGNDCLLRGDGDAALAAAESLFETMEKDNVEKVVYFFYPDPIGNQFASLKTCLDTLRPKMKALCDGLTAPKCYWLDLRPTWNGHNEYTQDGIHPTSAGSIATGDAIWEVMKTSCVAQ